jgi:hypothetical protein
MSWKSRSAAFAAAIAILLGVRIPSGADHGATEPPSARMLLSPNVHFGQVVAWRATLTQRMVSSSAHGTVVLVDRQNMNILCSIMSGSASSFAVSRHLRFMSDPWQDEPQVSIRRGREFDTSGRPLNRDPICMFYSATMYGMPPPVLRIGTTWNYHQPTDFRKHCERLTPDLIEHCLTDSEWVKASVTSLDPMHTRVGLHIVSTPPHDPRGISIIDMTVIDGGVIQQSLARYPNSALRGQPPDSVYWSLLRL